jgi:hypothetical protein
MFKEWIACMLTFSCFVLAVFIGDVGMDGLGVEHAVALFVIDTLVGFLTFRYLKRRGK